MPETLAFVVPWYGPDIPGGAESECRATARALAAEGVRVEILTTCARDHASGWSDHHPEGVSVEGGLTVRRFRTRPRDPERYAKLQRHLDVGGGLSLGEEEEFVRQSINSDDLYAYLAAEQDRYWYAFIPYCFGTSWEGVLAAPRRSIVIPCLHDEPFARLAWTRRLLQTARAVCFHVPAERALAVAVARQDPSTFTVVGEGVDTAPVSGDAGRFRERYGIREPYLLYAGRKAREKNVPLLIEYFGRYRRSRPTRAIKLVLIGSGELPVAAHQRPYVLDLGYVPAQDKYDACAGAVALCQPSLLESFSIVMMEAWLLGTATLVHAKCAVTRDHCLASSGGLFFGDFYEFAEAVDLLVDDAALRRGLGERGRGYVLERFTWKRVTANYLDLLTRLGARVA
jgi:glycosyltransferase involved in cell wall biosynthesis